MKRLLFLVCCAGLAAQFASCVSYIGKGIPVLKPAQTAAALPSKSTADEASRALYQPAPALNANFSVHQSRLFPRIRLTYGAFSYIGNTPAFSANPAASSVFGLHGEAGYVISTPDADWKIIGAETWMQPPLGTLPGFHSANQETTPNPPLEITVGLSSEVVFKHNRHPFGLRVFAGKPFGRQHDASQYLSFPTLLNTTAYTRHKNITAFAQLQISPKIHLTLGISYTLRKKLRNQGLYRER